jgi:hypothetical protein
MPCLSVLRFEALMRVTRPVPDVAPSKAAAQPAKPIPPPPAQFDFGCNEWPLRPDLLAIFLHSSVDVGQGFSGVAAKAAKIRTASINTLLVGRESASRC